MSLYGNDNYVKVMFTVILTERLQVEGHLLMARMEWGMLG